MNIAYRFRRDSLEQGDLSWSWPVKKRWNFVCAANQRYRLTYETTTKTPCELFDLQEDPDELTNRINDVAVKKLRNDMIDDLILPHMIA